MSGSGRPPSRCKRSLDPSLDRSTAQTIGRLQRARARQRILFREGDTYYAFLFLFSLIGGGAFSVPCKLNLSVKRQYAEVEVTFRRTRQHLLRQSNLKNVGLFLSFIFLSYNHIISFSLSLDMSIRCLARTYSGAISGLTQRLTPSRQAQHAAG
jgi:hypothetical protein